LGAFVAILLFVSIIAIISKFASKNEKINAKMDELKKKFIWNGIIDMISLQFLEVCLWWSAFIQINIMKGDRTNV
jgi:hypothetical protein